MPYFLDTSALVKLYWQETGTDAMLGLAERARPDEMHLSSLAGVELAAALRAVERIRRLPPGTAGGLLAQFREHLGWRFVRQPVNDWVLERAMALTERHPLRAYDAVQLASCLASAVQRPGGVLRGWRFVCSDRVLLAAAAAEGLDCFDPSGTKN